MSPPDSHEQLDPLDEVLDAYALQEFPASRQSLDTQTEPVEPFFANLHTFVSRWLMRVVERRVADGSQPGINWCAQWWAHPEALNRIYGLWRAWEVAHITNSMSLWWRDYFDPHLRILTAEHGPFVRCSPSRHYPPMHLPSLPIPDTVSATLPEGWAPADPHTVRPAVDPDRSTP